MSWFRDGTRLLISGAVGPGDNEHETTSIWLVSILGGAPRKLRDGAYRANLSPDDSLVAYMGMKGGIWLADADGENPREFVGAGEWEFLGSPEWSSDGKRVVYRRLGPSETTIESRGLDEETSTVLVRDGNFRFTNPGLAFIADFLMLDDRLVYAMNEPAPRNRDRNLWEVAVDPRSGKPTGEPRRLTDLVGFSILDLSVTADGSQLAFLNDRGQSDVYIGELGDGGRSLDNTRRLTLDDRDDSPSCWTPDGRAVVFTSDRNGNEDLLVQGLDRRNAQDLAIGAGDQSEPHLTPDGKSFLYWESQATAGGLNAPRRLLRIPVGGGPTELVLEVQGGAAIDCATTPDGPCLLGEARRAENIVTLSRLDPVAGRGEELFRIDIGSVVRGKPALSPDGTRFAMVGQGKDRSIRLQDALTGELIRDIDVDGLPGVTFNEVEWAPDGSGFYIAGESPRALSLLRVDLNGEAHVLHEDPTGIFSSVRPSPDGRHLAFEKATQDTNVWVIEGF
jgi:Tol biopolymer transport system component